MKTRMNFKLLDAKKGIVSCSFRKGEKLSSLNFQMMRFDRIGPNIIEFGFFDKTKRKGMIKTWDWIINKNTSTIICYQNNKRENPYYILDKGEEEDLLFNLKMTVPNRGIEHFLLKKIHKIRLEQANLSE